MSVKSPAQAPRACLFFTFLFFLGTACVHRPPADTGNTDAPGMAFAQPAVSHAEILRIVTSHVGELQDCYDRALTVSPTLKGDLLLRLVLSPDGGVNSAALSNGGTGYAELQHCVQTLAAQWTFPVFGGTEETEIEIPLHFFPAEVPRIDVNAPRPLRESVPPLRGAASMEEEVAMETVKAHSGAIADCYSKELVLHPELAGEATLSLTIAADGRVTATRVSQSSFADKDLENCILKIAPRWKFPPAQSGKPSTLDIPLVFHPVETTPTP